MKGAVVYARYSSERQTEQSIEGQLRVCNEFAKKNDLMILDTYIDRAVTGKIDQRDAFQKMLADSDKKQPWEIVLVYALDRFGRNSIDFAINKQRLMRNGKILISATQRTSQNIDGSQNLDGIILENVMIGISEYYSAELSQKVKRGLNENRLKGNFNGGPLAFGYKVIDKKVLIDEDKADIVRYIFQEYAAGNTAIDIIDALNDKGLTYLGKPFNKKTIYRMLRLKKYIGIYEIHDQTYDNIYPAIVPVSLFNEVQHILEKNKLGSASRATSFLLKGKLICGLCNKPINGESGTSRWGIVNYYYKCSTRKNNPALCYKENIRKDYLEDLVLNITMELINNPQNISLIADAVMNAHEDRLRNQSVLNILNTEKNRIQKSIDNILNAIESGIITPKTKERLMALETELEIVNVKIIAEECKIQNQLSKEKIVAFLTDAVLNAPSLIIDTLIQKIILFDDKIEIYYNYIDYPNPDELIEIRRDLILSQNKKITVTLSNFIYISSFAA